MRDYQADGEPIITKDRHIIKEGDWISFANKGCADDFIVKKVEQNGFYLVRVIWDDDDPNNYTEDSYREYVPAEDSKYYVYE